MNYAHPEVLVDTEWVSKNTAGKSKIMDFTIHKNQETTSEKPIFFVVSSSMEFSLRLVNMTAKFSNDKILLSEIEDSKYNY